MIDLDSIENSEGDNKSFTCSVEMGRPGPELNWLVRSSDGKKLGQLEGNVTNFSIFQNINEVDRFSFN